MPLRRPALLGYGILVTLIVIGLVRLEIVAGQVEREATRRVESVCESHDQLRDVVESLVEQSTSDVELVDPETLSSELRNLIERNRERQDRFRERALSLLEEAECPISSSRSPVTPTTNIVPIPSNAPSPEPTEELEDTGGEESSGTPPFSPDVLVSDQDEIVEQPEVQLASSSLETTVVRNETHLPNKSSQKAKEVQASKTKCPDKGKGPPRCR